MLVACRSAVLYSTHISNTQMQAEQLFLSAFAGKTIFLKEGFTMKKDGYYSSGEFARMAHVTLRTIRYYDKQNILKPSYVTESGARFYTDEDFARLSQILLLKYLGFSLDDIREMTIDDSDYHFMENSLNIQLKLVRDRIEQMQLVEKAIQDTTDAIRSHHAIDWNQMLDLIHLTGMEKSMKNQYQNASNISSRINLHSLYSQNKQGWFPWVYEQCQIHPGMRILELGCGDGALWTQNISSLPVEISVTLSDLSSGMLRDARRAIGRKDSRFSFEAFDCARIPHEDRSFDLVIANHVLFYCEDIPAVCSEIQRVLTPGGKLICSTYGKKHMQEVSRLVRDFDDRIVLSADRLYERFGRENGADILAPYFSRIFWESYRDSLLVPDAEPLISYILSCHGNQYILCSHLLQFPAVWNHLFPCGELHTEDIPQFMVVGFYQKRMIRQYLYQQVSGGIHYGENTSSLNSLQNSLINVIRHGIRNTSCQYQDISVSQSVNLFHQLFQSFCINIRATAIDLCSVNTFQLQIDSGHSVIDFDEISIYAKLVQSSDQFLSGESRRISQGCGIQSQILQYNRYIDSLSSRKNQL